MKWCDSGSDQDDIIEVYERFLSQDDSRTQRETDAPLFLTTGSQSDKGPEEVPDPKVTSLLEGGVATKVSSPTAEQVELTRPKQFNRNMSFASNHLTRDRVVLRVSDTSSDDNEGSLSPSRAKVMGTSDDDEQIIPATPEPSVSDCNGSGAGRKLMTGRRALFRNYGETDMSGALGVRGGVIDVNIDDPPPI